MKNKSSRRHPHQKRFTKLAQRLSPLLSFALLGAALCFTLFALDTTTQAAFASGTGPSDGSSTPMPGGTRDKPTCGTNNTLACPTPVTWIPITSESPAALMAAARQSPLFNVNRSGNGDFIKDLSHIGTPQFVLGMQAANGHKAPDFYVVPVEDSLGKSTIGAAQFHLDASHTHIMVDDITTYATSRPANTIAEASMSTALVAVKAKHNTSLRNGATPQLVYFPLDLQARDSGKITWNDGGTEPDDPIWMIPGADGRDHFVGVGGRVYLSSELPLAPSVFAPQP